MNYGNHFALQHYQKEQQRRESQFKKNQIFLINRKFQDLLNRLREFIEEGEFSTQIEHFQQMFHCSLWNVTFINNMENPKVALEQAIAINLFLHGQEESENIRVIELEADRLMSQLGAINGSIYAEFSHRKEQILQAQNRNKVF